MISAIVEGGKSTSVLSSKHGVVGIDRFRMVGLGGNGTKGWGLSGA